MNKSINILDKEYLQWVKDLCGRYRQSQIKAAVKVNVEQLKFNWLLGRDIVELHVEERWGESVITQLSKDLREAIPNAAGLSKSNIYYCRKFYLLYKDALKTFHQLGGKNETGMGIYIVLDGNRNADHVFCRWRAAGGSADCRNHACFLSVVFLLIAAQKKNRHTTVLIFAY